MLRIETPEELADIHKVRDLVKNLDRKEISDITLLRYLRARSTPAKAALSLYKTLKWREETNVASYLHWRPSNKMIPELLTLKYQGRDREGRPVFWIPLGTWPIRQLLSDGYREDVYRWRLYALEYVRSKTESLGQHQAVIIFGLEHLRLSQVLHKESMQIAYDVFKELEQYYPETIKTMYIINAPYFFPIAYDMMRPLLSPRTYAKLRIFNSNPDTWLDALQEAMPDKTIPKEYFN